MFRFTSVSLFRCAPVLLQAAAACNATKHHASTSAATATAVRSESTAVNAHLAQQLQKAVQYRCMEEIVRRHPYVKECVVVGVPRAARPSVDTLTQETQPKHEQEEVVMQARIVLKDHVYASLVPRVPEAILRFVEIKNRNGPQLEGGVRVVPSLVEE